MLSTCAFPFPGQTRLLHATRRGRLCYILTRSVCATQVQDRAVQSSEQWQDGHLLFERLQTLPNYEKCAWLCCTLLSSGLVS